MHTQLNATAARLLIAGLRSEVEVGIKIAFEF